MNVFTIGDPHFKSSNKLETDLLHKFCVDSLTSADDAISSADIIVVLGDIMHTHSRGCMHSFNRACAFLKDLVKFKRTYVLIGNHDRENNKVGTGPDHWFNELKIIPGMTIVDKPIIDSYNGFNFLLMPYVPSGEFESIYSKVITKEKLKSFDCVFSHQSFRGCKLSPTMIDNDGDIWDEDMPFVVNGHLHDRHRAKKNIYCPGTPITMTFQCDRKGISLIKFFKDSIPNIEFREIKGPKIIRSRISVDEFNEFTVPDDIHKLTLIVHGVKSKLAAVSKTTKWKRLNRDKFVRLIREVDPMEAKDSKDDKDDDKCEEINIRVPYVDMVINKIKEMGDDIDKETFKMMFPEFSI